MSKRHGSIDTSIYGSEFCAISTTVKEVQVVRYMLRFLVVKVKHATFLCRYNKGVIYNCNIPDSLLKKKYVAISYHNNRESAAAGICHPIKIDTKHSFDDMLTN